MKEMEDAEIKLNKKIEDLEREMDRLKKDNHDLGL